MRKLSETPTSQNKRVLKPAIEVMALGQFQQKFRPRFAIFYHRNIAQIPLWRLETGFRRSRNSARDWWETLPSALDFLRLRRSRGVRAFTSRALEPDRSGVELAQIVFGHLLVRRRPAGGQLNRPMPDDLRNPLIGPARQLPRRSAS